jgi:hypothetical protein
MNLDKELKSTRLRIWIVVAGLFLSGVTAFPLETELKLIYDNAAGSPEFMRQWLGAVYHAIAAINSNYPFLSYGTDWLAFAHLMLAILFAGAVKDPVKNVWIIQFGVIAAVCIFPLAFIAGGIRGIPVFWRLIDCSFGVVTLVLLIPCLRMIKGLENIAAK